jgi:hypothetical protein
MVESLATHDSAPELKLPSVFGRYLLLRRLSLHQLSSQNKNQSLLKQKNFNPPKRKKSSQGQPQLRPQLF